MRVKKRDLRGQQNAPSPTEKVPDARRPRVPVTLWHTKKAIKNPKRGRP